VKAGSSVTHSPAPLQKRPAPAHPHSTATAQPPAAAHSWQRAAPAATPRPPWCKKPPGETLRRGKGVFVSTAYRFLAVKAQPLPAVSTGRPVTGEQPSYRLPTRFPAATGHETITTAHLRFNPQCFTRMESNTKQGEITPKMSSLTGRQPQLATDLLLAYTRSKQPRGLLHVFLSQSCLPSFALPSGTFLPMIRSDV